MNHVESSLGPLPPLSYQSRGAVLFQTKHIKSLPPWKTIGDWKKASGPAPCPSWTHWNGNGRIKKWHPTTMAAPYRTMCGSIINIFLHGQSQKQILRHSESIRTREKERQTDRIHTERCLVQYIYCTGTSNSILSSCTYETNTVLVYTVHVLCILCRYTVQLSPV